MAWLALTLGLASHLVPRLESNARRFRRFVQLSFPVALVALLLLGASPGINDRIKRSSESARALPPSGTPNLLLIVLDTVAAGHLSLYGYPRPTSTTLAELAERGIRFDSAQATSSWTLPSHATIFTGRWMHELSVGWLNPLDREYPTLAEFLGDRGYATAGFIANTSYCASDSGLSRGFTRYEDFIFPRFTAPKTAVLVNRVLACVGRSCRSWRPGRRSPGCNPMCRGSGSRSSTIARALRPSTASSSAGCRGGPSRAALLRLLELLRRPYSLRAGGGPDPSFRRLSAR